MLPLALLLLFVVTNAALVPPPAPKTLPSNSSAPHSAPNSLLSNNSSAKSDPKPQVDFHPRNPNSPTDRMPPLKKKPTQPVTKPKVPTSATLPAKSTPTVKSKLAPNVTSQANSTLDVKPKLSANATQQNKGNSNIKPKVLPKVPPRSPVPVTTSSSLPKHKTTALQHSTPANLTESHRNSTKPANVVHQPLNNGTHPKSPKLMEETETVLIITNCSVDWGHEWNLLEFERLKYEDVMGRIKKSRGYVALVLTLGAVGIVALIVTIGYWIHKMMQQREIKEQRELRQFIAELDQQLPDGFDPQHPNNQTKPLLEKMKINNV